MTQILAIDKIINLLIILTFLFFIPSKMISAQHILITYYSLDGHTEKMASAVAEGAQISGKSLVRLRTIRQTDHDDLLWADAIIVGSPVHVGNVAAPVQQFISQWPFDQQELKNKIGAAFTTGGGISAGEELTQLNILHSMLVHQMIIIGGPSWSQPFGASAVTGEDPFTDNSEGPSVNEMFIKKGNALGQRVAEIARKMDCQ